MISVLIPTRGRPGCLREALEGLAGVAATLQEALGPGEVEVAGAPGLPPGVQTLGPVRVRVALE